MLVFSVFIRVNMLSYLVVYSFIIFSISDISGIKFHNGTKSH